MSWLPSALRLASQRVAAAAAACTAAAVCAQPPALAAGEQADAPIVMSGDCGGTNTRLILFKVTPGTTVKQGSMPSGKVIFEKKYKNDDYTSFTEVCQTFLRESSSATKGAKPSVCCLACAGGIKDNTVSFTNVKAGWIIDGNNLSATLGIPLVKLINDFEAQGYGLLTLQPHEYIKLTSAEPKKGAPIACVGAGTGLGECYLTASDGKYTCWPSEGGHAEFSPRSELTSDLLHHMRERLTLFTPAQFDGVFDRWDANHDGHIDKAEFMKAVSDDGLKGLKPKRISVERIVSGPGISSLYEFLSTHWAFAPNVDPKMDAEYRKAKPSDRSAIVAKYADQGQVVCKKAIDVFNECYGSEVGVAALKWLPFGGLYISGGIAAKNPKWIQSQEFMSAYEDKGRLSVLVKNVPLFLVLTEDTGERGALFYAVQMLG